MFELNTVKEIMKFPSSKVLDLLVSNPKLRKIVSDYAKKTIYKSTVINNELFTKPIREARYQAVSNFISVIDKAISEKSISKSVKKRISEIFMERIVDHNHQIKDDFVKKYNREPPDFLVLSPEKRCNLRCTGCYAASTAKASEHLDFDVVDRIITEKKNLWDSYFNVISGGEPLMWRSDGKSILDLFEKHQDNFFMMYTNGTLITKEVAKRMAESGNITPAISLEGFETKTDKRRGKGTYKKILQAMENLREAGVVFGVSLTATKENYDEILSDEFINYFFDEQKARYGWIFQYMPIGKSYTLDLMVTPEQRKWMLEQEHKFIFDKELFLIDFWNGGLFTHGCIAAGRPGGYFYIEWNGNVTPCAFVPYSPINIQDVFKKGGNLNDIMEAPFFQKVRKYQLDYGYESKSKKVGNWFAPCPIRDHHEVIYNAIKETNALPIDNEAKEALEDDDYNKGMVEYGKKFQELTNEKWEKEFLEGD